MWVKVTKSIATQVTNVSVGDVVDLEKEIAADWIKAGYAEAAEDPNKVKR